VQARRPRLANDSRSSFDGFSDHGNGQHAYPLHEVQGNGNRYLETWRRSKPDRSGLSSEPSLEPRDGTNVPETNPNRRSKFSALMQIILCQRVRRKPFQNALRSKNLSNRYIEKFTDSVRPVDSCRFTVFE